MQRLGEAAVGAACGGSDEGGGLVFPWGGAVEEGPGWRIEDGAGGVWELGENGGVPEGLCGEIRRATLIAHGVRPCLRQLLGRAGVVPMEVVCTEGAAGLLAAGGSDALDLEAVSGRYSKGRLKGGTEPDGPVPGGAARLLRVEGGLRRAILAAGLGRVFELEMSVLPILAGCDVCGVPVDPCRLAVLRDGFLREAGESVFRLGGLLRAPTLDPENSAQLERMLARAGIRVRSASDAALLQANEGKVIPEIFVFRRKSALARLCRELLESGRCGAGGEFRIPGGGFQAAGSEALEELLCGELAGGLKVPAGRRLVVQSTRGARFELAARCSPESGGEDDPAREAAAWIFQRPPGGVGPEELRVGQIVIDGLTLGMGADTMAGEVLRSGLRLPGDPQATRQSFFLRHAEIARWHEACQRQARERLAEARTALGRRVLFSAGANTWQRFSGLVATTLCGGSEDAVKSAAVRLSAELAGTARLVGVTEHALCVECGEGELEAVRSTVKNTWCVALRAQRAQRAEG